MNRRNVICFGKRKQVKLTSDDESGDVNQIGWEIGEDFGYRITREGQTPREFMLDSADNLYENVNYESGEEISIGSLNIKLPATDSSKWKVVVDEKFKPDRGSYILAAFADAYPDVAVKISTVEEVYALASRSKKLTTWLANTNIIYSQQANTPVWYRDAIPAEKFKKAANILIKVNDAESTRSAELEKASREYRNKCKEINDKINKSINSITKDDKYVQVMALNTTSLPLSLQLLIEKFSPAEGSDISAKAFGREVLASYKLSLIEKINADENFDVQAEVDSNATK